MNEKKESKLSSPTAPPPSQGAADDAWDDDDDGGDRTVTTEAPSFELLGNIPSPITVPPPRLAPPAQKFPKKATLVGLMASDFLPPGGGFPSSGRLPAEASPVAPAPFGFPEEAINDLPFGRSGPVPQQDAHVVVASDAEGDGATLALEPGKVQGIPRELREAFAATMQAAPVPVAHEVQSAAGRVLPSPMSSSFQGEVAPSYRDPPHGFVPSSPRGHELPPPQSNRGEWGGQLMAPHGPHAHGPGVQAQHAMAPQPNAPYPPALWLTPPQTPGAQRFTPQVLLLAGLAVVCLAIFVIGIVLFLSTRS